MKHLNKLLTILLLLSAGNMMAQTLSEFKPKETSYGLNKLKGKAKKIYIAGFNVVYQVYNEKQDFKQGGSMLGGGVRGDAMAEASIGLDGLTDDNVQKITDKLYADYLGMLREKGLTVVSADEAARTSVYSDYVKITGGKVSMAQFPGTMTTSPTNYVSFVKKVDKDGKTKSGGFLNNPAMLYPKLSSELDDAIIADVDLYVMFVEDKNAFRGNGANIKITTNLRLAASEAIVMTSDAKIKFKGQNTVTGIASAVNFYHGKMGAGATTSYVGNLKEPILISGVIEDTKVQSFANRSADAIGTKTIYGTIYSAANKSSKTAKVVDVETAKYETGVYQAGKKFLEHHTKQFLSGI